ncbi:MULTISPECIES: AAA family ATPase [Streptomyces]|uniref:AAA family ATPase n=1 Tax=Streptomyces TaxID=1883 RepID=UPI0004A9DB1F|nr:MULTISPECIES: AAA family ATPase [Streptomyces]
MRRPTLVAVSGPPGAGKTTLAHALADALDWPLVCRDEIKERMAGAEPIGAESAEAGPAGDQDLRTLHAFFRTIGELLGAGRSLVAEAAFQDRLWRPGLEALAVPADLRVVRCVVDPELARLRIARRAADVPSRAVHADAELLRRIAAGERPIESWVPIATDAPCLVVDTTEGWEPSLARIVGFASGTP